MSVPGESLEPQQPAGGDAPRRRGRPRSEGLRRTILEAAAELLDQRGVEGTTVEAVAERAGVGKQTIYRRWPTRAAVLVEAFLAAHGPDVVRPDSGSLRRDLRDLICAVSDSADNATLRRTVAGLVAAGNADPEVGRLFQERFVAATRASLRTVLERAAERGELDAETSLELVIDQLLGPVWYRALLCGGRLDHAYADALIAQVLKGVTPREPKVGESRARKYRPGEAIPTEATIDLFGEPPGSPGA